MEPPKKDNVIDFMERLKEKIENESSVIKEMPTETDFEKFGAMVVDAIVKIQEDMITILDFFNAMAVRQEGLHDAFFLHSHNEDGFLKFPEGFKLYSGKGPDQDS